MNHILYWKNFELANIFHADSVALFEAMQRKFLKKSSNDDLERSDIIIDQ